MPSKYFKCLWKLIMDFRRNQTKEFLPANQSFYLNSLDGLYQKLDEAEQDVREGKTFTHEEVIARLEERLERKS
jgi:hypothetical protein